MSGKPTPAFYLAVVAVVAGLIGFAAWQAGLFGDGGGGGENVTDKPTEDIDPTKLGVGGGDAEGAEAPDAQAITTVKEYTFTPSEKLPPVKGTAAYKPMQDNTVRFALNVWAGWAPIIMANNGFSAGKVWKTADGQDFKVELVLSDDPVKMRDAYAAGEVHIGWATLDMVPLFMEGFVDRSGKPRDSRVMPRIYQQVDWSNGGDGIVVRDSIKTVADLRGKTMVLAQNSPSEYFALNMLVRGGLQPSEVNMKYTPSAFEAAAAFNSDKSISAAVSWAPDIYNLSEVKGNRMLVTTETANKLIADVWFARADFAAEHPEIVEGIVRGIFDGMEALKTEEGRRTAADLMGKGFGLPSSEALAMLGDAHSTNWAENYQFFLNQNNPTRFEVVWRQAYYLYRKTGAVTHTPVPFDQVMDFSVIKKLGGEEKYSSTRDEYSIQFGAKPTKQIIAEQDEVLANRVTIHFFPNSSDLFKKITRTVDGETVEEMYDPQVEFLLDEIATLVGQFGAARVIVEGHTDASMRGRLPDDSVVKELSRARANAVKQALVEKHNLDPNQLNVEGIGWDRPADQDDPNNHAKNRRVEIRIFSAEQG